MFPVQLYERKLQILVKAAALAQQMFLATTSNTIDYVAS